VHCRTVGRFQGDWMHDGWLWVEGLQSALAVMAFQLLWSAVRVLLSSVGHRMCCQVTQEYCVTQHQTIVLQTSRTAVCSSRACGSLNADSPHNSVSLGGKCS
jgi:hypothetical protein